MIRGIPRNRGRKRADFQKTVNRRFAEIHELGKKKIRGFPLIRGKISCMINHIIKLDFFLIIKEQLQNVEKLQMMSCW